MDVDDEYLGEPQKGVSENEEQFFDVLDLDANDLGDAPKVTLLMVAHNPGVWFVESLLAVAELDYPDLEIVVVDSQSKIPITAQVAEILPDAQVIRLEENRGFGRAVNAALREISPGPLLLLAHDDVAPQPDALRHMVEEVFRSNAGVVGPKVVRWDDPTRIISVGEGVDKFAFPAGYVERGELDQQQHDAVRDIFNLPDGFTLVRTDLLLAVGGFDNEMQFFGDDLDLCWRVHVAGGRVVVAPNAVVRHQETLGARRGFDDRRRHQFRARLRTLLATSQPFTLIRILPQLMMVNLLEAVLALLLGRPRQAADVLGAWFWNLRRLGSLRQRRAGIKRIRTVTDTEIRALQVGGSARVSAFVRGQLGSGESGIDGPPTLSERLVQAATGQGRRFALLAWTFTILLLLAGSRHLLTRSVPMVGEFLPLPEVIGPTFRAWIDSFSNASAEVGGFGATGEVLGALLVGVFLGAAGFARLVVTIGLLPLGLYGMWRLTVPMGSIRASVTSLLAYLAVPIGIFALGSGSWRALLAYGLLPWVFARLFRASGNVPFAAGDPNLDPSGLISPGPTSPVAPLWRQTLILGLVVGVAAAFDPIWVVVPLLLWVTMLPGSLVVGYLGGLWRMLVAATGALVVAVTLNAPWFFELFAGDIDWSVITGGRSVAHTGVSGLELLRFETHPGVSSWFTFGLVVASGLVLLVGRRWRLAVAARLWSIQLCFWGFVWLVGRLELTVALPPLELVLAPVGVSLALLAGLGDVAFDVDVRRRGFSWRQLASFGTALALVMALVPMVASSVGGRWNMPRGDFHQTLKFLDTENLESPFRVLWIGHPESLPLVGNPLTNDMVYAVTDRGAPELENLWPGAAPPREDPLRAALDLALEGRSTRIGEELATLGFRYVVLVDQLAPAPYVSRSHPVSVPVVQAMNQQLDLERLEINPALRLYQNVAWVPIELNDYGVKWTEPWATSSGYRAAWLAQIVSVVLLAVLLYKTRLEKRSPTTRVDVAEATQGLSRRSRRRYLERRSGARRNKTSAVRLASESGL